MQWTRFAGARERAAIQFPLRQGGATWGDKPLVRFRRTMRISLWKDWLNTFDQFEKSNLSNPFFSPCLGPVNWSATSRRSWPHQKNSPYHEPCSTSESFIAISVECLRTVNERSKGTVVMVTNAPCSRRRQHRQFPSITYPTSSTSPTAGKECHRSND